MDIQQYISSGILELYAAGALSPEEMRAVERVLADYPDVRRELNDIEDALEQFAMLNAKPPRENVKANLLQKIGENEQIEIPGNLLKESHALKEPEVLKEKPQATVLPFQHQAVSKSRVPYYLAAASTAGLILTSASAMYFYSQWKTAEYELLSINNEKNKTEQEYSLMQASLKDINYDLGIIVHKNTKAVPITAVKEGMNDGAVVYWNSVTKDVYLKFDKLPPPPAGQQYQLWAIKGGKPVNEGVFEVNSAAIHKMPTVEQPEAFAVTMEPMGGSENPTMEKMMWFGKL